MTEVKDVEVPGGRAKCGMYSASMRYYTVDHLGSTRLVTDASGDVKGQYDYLPYGGKCDNTGLEFGYVGYTDYLYCGKEWHELFGIDWYDSKSRYLNTSGIFTSIDPVAEKYPGISPYAYCAGDPVNRIDPEGNSFDDYVFNKNGSYVGCIENGSPDKIVVNTLTGSINIAFADPVNDPSSINDQTKIIIPPYDLINNTIEQSGATDNANHGIVKGCRYLLNHSDSSKNNGELDYIVQMAVLQTEPENSINLYVSYTDKDGFVAHNAHNYANFLWGASAKALGVPLALAKLGAHINNFFFDNHFKWTLDSKDDQYSITVGYHWK